MCAGPRTPEARARLKAKLDESERLLNKLFLETGCELPKKWIGENNDIYNPELDAYLPLICKVRQAAENPVAWKILISGLWTAHRMWHKLNNTGCNCRVCNPTEKTQLSK